MDEYFSAWFLHLPCVLPGLAHRANNFMREVSHHFLCVQCARPAIMAMAGRNRTPQILRLATGLLLRESHGFLLEIHDHSRYIFSQ